MAFFNITSQDSTPLLTYSPAGAWQDSPADALSTSYGASSWHVASAAGASASLTFTGTGAWLYGANRPTYGQYSIAVDGKQVVSASAAADSDAFHVLLGGIGGLEYGNHTIVLVNADGTGPVDLDEIIFETMIGSEGDELVTNTVGAAESPFVYMGNWVNTSALEYTDFGGAQIAYNFTGDAISIMGSMSAAYGSYTVEVDGHVQAMSASTGMEVSFAHQGSLLYFSNNLGAGSHRLLLTANPGEDTAVETGKYVGITNVNVFSALTGPNQANVNVPTTVQQSEVPLPTTLLLSPAATGLGNTNANVGNMPNTPSPVHYDMLIGAIAGSLGLFIICAGLFVFWIKRRRVKRRRMIELEPPASPKSFVQRPRSDATGAFGRPTISRQVLERAMEPMPPMPMHMHGNPFADAIINPFRDPDSESTLSRSGSSSWSYRAPTGEDRARPTPSPIPPPYGSPYRYAGHHSSSSGSSISSVTSEHALLVPAREGSSAGVGVAA